MPMSLLNPTVTVALDKERHLCFGALAFIEYKELTGNDLLKSFSVLGEKLQGVSDTHEVPMKELRDILWAALIHEDESLTPRQVSMLFDLRGMPEIVTALTKAFEQSLPKIGELKTTRPRPAPVNPKKLTGASSGASVPETSASPGPNSGA